MLVADALKDHWQADSDPDRVWRQDRTIAEIGKLVGAPSYDEVVTKLAKKQARHGSEFLLVLAFQG